MTVHWICKLSEHQKSMLTTQALLWGWCHNLKVKPPNLESKSSHRLANDGNFS